MTIYQDVGGEPIFFEIVEKFYEGVAADPLMRPLYPEDLEPSKRYLALFLMQAFEGPLTYLIERGHPALRYRHRLFPIDQEMRDHWMDHMRVAVQTSTLTEPMQQEFLTYFEKAATFLINRKPAEAEPTA